MPVPAILSETAICNLGLGLAGQRQFIDNFTDSTTEASVAGVYYRPALIRTLSAFHWRFAKRRAVLALSPSTRTGWAYCYAMPADCLAARALWPGRRDPGYGEGIAFEKELNDAGDGHLICTDLASAELSYTALVTAVGLFPAHFVSALAAQLAVYFAAALSVKPELARSLQPQAVMELQMAMAVDAREGRNDDTPDSEFIRGR